MLNLIAITVSVNYHDTLPLVIETNHKYFKHWYIVTESTDVKTQEICSAYSNIEVLFFNFKTEEFIFNKGGALRYAQEKANQLFKDEFKIVIDSDICLPNSFQNILETVEFKENVLYGAHRFLVETIEDYKDTDKQFQLDRRVIPLGYFHLYKSNILYEDSVNCSLTDYSFAHKFNNGSKVFLELNVHHIGPIGVNWSGKEISLSEGVTT